MFKINCNTTDLLWILRKLRGPLNLNSWSPQVNWWSSCRFHLRDLQGLWKQVISVVSDKILSIISPEGTCFSRAFVLYAQNPVYKCILLTQILVYKSLIYPLEKEKPIFPDCIVRTLFSCSSVFLCFLCFVCKCWLSSSSLCDPTPT